MTFGKNTSLAALFLSAFALMGVGKAWGAVTVTGATGGSSISADTAGNAWTTLGAITIVEGASDDFSADTNVTLVLQAPTGFVFNQAVIPDITFAAGGDITGAEAAMTDGTCITLTLTASGTNAADSLTLGG